MPALIKGINKKIKELQRAPDNVKTRWFIGATTFSMAIIIGLWVVYLNATLPKIGKAEAENTDTQKSSKKESFFNTFNMGLNAIGEDFKEKFGVLKNQLNQNAGDLKNKLEKNNEFLIENKNGTDFLPEKRETVPKTPLP